MARRRPVQSLSRRRQRRLVVEGLESRRLLAGNVAVAADASPTATPLVRLVDAATGVEQASVLAFDAGYRGGVRLAMGHVTGNAAADVVAVPGSGLTGEVRVFKPVTTGGTTTLTQVLSFTPFGPGYRGGLEVAVGDVDGDSVEDIVVSKSREGGDVKVFRVTNPGGTPTATLYATIAKPFGASYNGGSTVGVADVGEFANGALVKSVGDNKVEILVGTGAGLAAQVKVYDVSRPAAPRVADTIAPAFVGAPGQAFTGGVWASSGRYSASGVADSIDDIVVSAGRGGSGAVQTIVYDGKVSSAANTVLKSFAPFTAAQRPNAAVYGAAVDADGNGQVDRFLVTQGDAGGPAGIANVSIAGVKSTVPVTSLVGPLRIAAPRTVFQPQTINGTVATPSPTAGVTAGASRPMQIREIVTGSGEAANVGNTLTVQYTGMLTNGTVFDTSRQAGRTAFSLTLGAGQVIKGWEAGLEGMRVGGRRLLVIPPELAYGDAARTGIPAKSTLVFDVELVSVSGNSTASISGTSTGALTAGAATNTVGDTLTVTDPDAGQAEFAVPGALDKTYGTFTFNASTGAWGYTLDNSRAATRALVAGQTVTDSLAVTSKDGTASRTIVVTVTGADDAPADIALSAATVAENTAAGTTVGTLSTTDVDSGDTFTYTLVSGTGATDNASFTIVGNALKTAASFDFETQSSYSVRVRSTDSGGLSTEKQFTITVTNVNEAPTDIALSAVTVEENAASGTTVGTLSTTDVDSGDTFTYTLVPGTGATDNASFAIVGNALKTAASFDFETQSSYSVRVRSTDSGGLSTEKQFTITVTNVNEPAAIVGTTSGSLSADDTGGTATGTVSVIDPDAGEAVFQTPTSLAGTYGDFTFDATTGAWSYALVTNRISTIVLTSDKTVTDSLTVTSADGSATETIVVSVTGYTMQSLEALVPDPSPSAAVAAGSTSVIRYRQYQAGSGDVATVGSLVTVRYIGMLADGTVFDAALSSPAQFTLDLNNLIAGWVYGVDGMQVGEVRVLVIPPELAYGDAGSGTAIPGDATLTFIVELVAVTAP